MSARAWRALAVGLLLFGGVGVLLVVGAGVVAAGDQALVRHWLSLSRGPWALPLCVGVFAILAFLGAPQFVLIAAAVVVYGVWPGMAYSWIGTVGSSLVGFWLGRVFGPGMISDLHSAVLDRFAGLIARNGFIASLVIRLVPFAPFIVVNLGAGVTAIPLAEFVAGTALGIIPKILLVGLAGGSIERLTGGAGGGSLGVVALAAGTWAAAVLLARHWLRRGSRLP
jgi:uncharacterized membrane protein YdjX (TVP38/TMEM64 family)